MCAIENYHIKSDPAFIEEKTEMCMLTNWTWLDGISMQGIPKGNQTLFTVYIVDFTCTCICIIKLCPMPPNLKYLHLTL